MNCRNSDVMVPTWIGTLVLKVSSEGWGQEVQDVRGCELEER